MVASALILPIILRMYAPTTLRRSCKHDLHGKHLLHKALYHFVSWCEAVLQFARISVLGVELGLGCPKSSCSEKETRRSIDRV